MNVKCLGLVLVFALLYCCRASESHIIYPDSLKFIDSAYTDDNSLMAAQDYFEILRRQYRARITYYEATYISYRDAQLYNWARIENDCEMAARICLYLEAADTTPSDLVRRNSYLEHAMRLETFQGISLETLDTLCMVAYQFTDSLVEMLYDKMITKGDELMPAEIEHILQRFPLISEEHSEESETELISPSQNRHRRNSRSSL